ncbi:P2R1A-PPP2R2A-interacting phosphatase regulator 1-like isoform X1 [Myxocyprinus asiaticus]|uniref:P2R1A-PPP2R2A-interacting phosphatase regulator 1-like isoform X1 n=1 Tax=Myxocyprinus asiaticus TaxID=70543 RepID=UPI0022220843|nr:P2R1A-PPP2R2A-interacting phosphatase regulator 1-like isoform X1 [Myxocyprinus asiaticus]
MERMEVDQCAGAGGALRRSNSAPMINVSHNSDGMTVFSSNYSARYRRSSVSVNPSLPSRTLPLSPFSLSCERSEHKRQIENMELTLRGSLQRLSASPFVPFPPASHWHDHLSPGFYSQDSGVTPNSSPSPTRRFRGVLFLSPHGGVEIHLNPGGGGRFPVASASETVNPRILSRGLLSALPRRHSMCGGFTPSTAATTLNSPHAPSRTNHIIATTRRLPHVTLPSLATRPIWLLRRHGWSHEEKIC